MITRPVIVFLCLWLTFTEGRKIGWRDNSRCRYTTSTGVIDLNPLANDNGTPRFKDIADPQSTFVYSWNPCISFSEQSCEGVQVCQLDLTNPDNDYVLGKSGDSFFTEESGRLYLVYQAMSPYDRLRVTKIELICDQSTEGKLQFIAENPTLTYELRLTSQYACPVSVTTPTPVPGTTSRPSPGPGPKIFNIKTITILLACILMSLLLLLFLVFMGLITRR